MDGGAWWAAVHGIAEGRTQLSDFTFTFHFHALEKEMATHSSVLAWRIPGTEEPGGLPSMGLHRVGHNWSDLAADSVSFHCFTLPLESSKVFLTLAIPLLPLSWILSEQPSSFTTPGETGLHRVPGDCLIAKSSRQFPSSPHLTSYPMGEVDHAYPWNTSHGFWIKFVMSDCHQWCIHTTICKLDNQQGPTV